MTDSETALLVDANQVRLVEESDDKATFTGQLGSQFNIGTVPNGGYTLGVAVSCAHDVVKRRRGTEQADLFSCYAAYHAKVTSQRPLSIEVRVLKRGRNTTQVEVDVVQETGPSGSRLLCVRVPCLFANMTALRADPFTNKCHIDPISPLAPSFPMTFDHHNRSNAKNWFRRLEWPKVVDDEEASRLARQQDQLIVARYMYLPDQPNVSPAQLPAHNTLALCLLADTTAAFKGMLPPKMVDEQGNMPAYWFPTMWLSMEMQRPLPSYPLQRAACKARTASLIEGQWSFEVEIWSHPDDAERMGLPAGQKSALLAVSRQTALTMSMEVNTKSKKAKM